MKRKYFIYLTKFFLTTTMLSCGGNIVGRQNIRCQEKGPLADAVRAAQSYEALDCGALEDIIVKNYRNSELDKDDFNSLNFLTDSQILYQILEKDCFNLLALALGMRKDFNRCFTPSCRNLEVFLDNITLSLIQGCGYKGSVFMKMRLFREQYMESYRMAYNLLRAFCMEDENEKADVILGLIAQASQNKQEIKQLVAVMDQVLIRNIYEWALVKERSGVEKFHYITEFFGKLLLSDEKDDDIVVYTDGSFVKESGRGGYAYIILGDGTGKEGLCTVEHENSGKMELKAICEAVKFLQNRYKEDFGKKNIRIYTDHNNSVNIVENVERHLEELERKINHLKNEIVRRLENCGNKYQIENNIERRKNNIENLNYNVERLKNNIEMPAKNKGDIVYHTETLIKGRNKILENSEIKELQRMEIPNNVIESIKILDVKINADMEKLKMNKWEDDFIEATKGVIKVLEKKREELKGDDKNRFENLKKYFEDYVLLSPLKGCKNIQIGWVKGHASSIYNIRCDELAQNSAHLLTQRL